MKGLMLATIARWTEGHLYGPDGLITHICHDTRNDVRDALYVCLHGEHFDGHQFCAMAAQRGAVGLLLEQRQESVSLGQIVVKNTQIALAQIAAALQRTRSTRVFLVTGSNGKTTVKTMLFSILRQWGKAQQRTVYVNPGNYNNEIGLPIAVIQAADTADDAVYEMGAGKPGDIAYLLTVVKPSIALVNTIAPAHLERLGHLLGVAETKGAIYAALGADGIAIVNADDAFAQWFIQTRIPPHCRVLRFGIQASAHISARQISTTASATQFHLVAPSGDIPVTIPFGGVHHIRNALAAAAMACAAGVSLEAIAQGLAVLEPLPGRQRVHSLPHGITLIDDSYNANMGSVQAAIDVLAKTTHPWLVLGDMHELGEKSRQLHAMIGHLARHAGIKRVYTFGPLSQRAAEAFGPGAVACLQDHTQLIATLRCDLDVLVAANSSPRAMPTVLIKGSRASAMDKIVDALLASHGGDTHVA